VGRGGGGGGGGADRPSPPTRDSSGRRDRRPWSARRSKRRSGRGRRATAPETARRTPPGWMSGFDLMPSGERGQSDIGMTSNLMHIVSNQLPLWDASNRFM